VSDEVVDWAQIERDVLCCTSAHSALIADLGRVGRVDPTTPSRLPGWSVAHLLTHIARNASSHVEMLAGRPQYKHGMDSRNEDIETGSRRPWEQLVDDVESTCSALDAIWSQTTDWSGISMTIVGERPKRMLPMLRWREVEIHHVDLGFGYEFADMPSEYIRKDLRLWEMLWTARRPMGLTPLPAAAMAVLPHERLAWLVGRTEIDGLEPARLF
jgi:maleylpyruvate isomerase